MNDEWETPDDLYSVLNEEFNFEVDLCANEENTKCENFSDDVYSFYESNNDRREQFFWMNPPYSRGNIEPCMKIASYLGSVNTVVCLVRFDPSAKWFQRWVDDKACEVRMLSRRVKFKGAESAYNFPCCIVVYSPFAMNAWTNTKYFLWDWKEGGEYSG